MNLDDSSEKRPASPDCNIEDSLLHASPSKTPRLQLLQEADCPICLQRMQEPYVTRCGHSFCHTCLQRHLGESMAFCPTCRKECTVLEVAPNYALAALLRTVNNGRLAASKKPMKDEFAMESVVSFLKILESKKNSLMQQLEAEREHLQRDISLLNKSSATSLRLSSENIEELSASYDRLSSCAPFDRMKHLGKQIRLLTGNLQLKSVSSVPVSGEPSIVSAIEIDREDRLFATGGVSRRIRIFDLPTILESSSLLLSSEPIPQYPVLELETSSKLSCLSWNPFHTSQLAAADYEGVVSIYDVAQVRQVARLQEHTRRIWSIDFCPLDATRLASGSDDCNVRVWSTRKQRSCLSLNTRANVCSVRFSPADANLLALGSADHSVSVYDIRSFKDPLYRLQDHKKSVSYVRWIDGETLLSASTDNSLKIWNARDRTCTRTLIGHSNEKNFIGLSLARDSGLVACGSENNACFLYSQEVSSKPITSFSFSVRFLFS